MRLPLKTAATAALVATASAQDAIQQGFNYGATNADGSCRTYNDYVNFFNQAKNLPGAPAGGFTSARLYTSVQCGTANAPIEAFQAAMDTNTHLLIGLWASAGRDVYANELNAMIAAANQFGSRFTDLITGISVGSEDLYRASPQGIAAGSDPGATGAEIEGYIGWLWDWVRDVPGLNDKPVGHVDTWTAWILPENQGVISMVDFLGHNSFPYFEANRGANGIDQARDNFYSAVAETERVAAGKAVWVTETGWPRSGPTSGQAVASPENQQRYWKDVGCSLFGGRNTYWYTLKDSNAAQTEMSFAITRLENGDPLIDITC